MSKPENAEDVGELFNEVLHEISDNIMELMKELWYNWSHLGVDHQTKIKNITKLVQIEKDLHRDVKTETKQRLKELQKEVHDLKAEATDLGRFLSVDISLMDYKEEMLLSDYKKELEDQITGYREQVKHRRTEMERLLEWQRDLADKLGVTIHELQEVPLPSEEELDKLRAHLQVLQGERDKRVETFLNTQMEIKDIMDKLHIKPQNKFELLAQSALSVDFKVTDHNMDLLAKLRQDLQHKYEVTNNRVLELRERLAKLWECLEEDQIYLQNFLQAHPGCHPETEAALKEEIKRCDQIKRQKIQVFVAKVRTKIKLMWDALLYSRSQREKFVHYYQDVFSEDTLTLHELYLDQITNYYNEHKHIYDLVNMRKELWTKMSELEARATEPGRYHNRGGQLLREEKERKVISCKLPKIEEQLRVLVAEFQEKTGDIFTVDGKPLGELMDEEWENLKAERHNKLSARKQALTPNTPALLRSLAVSPLGKRNRTAAGLAATAEKIRLPAKRQLMTASATKLNINNNNNSALKRNAVTTVKRRISGRLAARLVADGKPENVKRKLDYQGNVAMGKTPKVQSNILKHKRKSSGRRSSSRRSISTTQSTGTEELVRKDPLMETTMMTTYTDFKDRINEKQISRSSLATAKENIPIVRVCESAIMEHNTPIPKKNPKKFLLTPRNGKENINHMPLTPKTNLLSTPTRLTRSSVKLNSEGFATPRTPFSVSKQNVQRQNTFPAKSPLPMGRSNSHTNLTRVKNLPLLP